MESADASTCPRSGNFGGAETSERILRDSSYPTWLTPVLHEVGSGISTSTEGSFGQGGKGQEVNEKKSRLEYRHWPADRSRRYPFQLFGGTGPSPSPLDPMSIPLGTVGEASRQALSETGTNDGTTSNAKGRESRTWQTREGPPDMGPAKRRARPPWGYKVRFPLWP